MCARAINRIEVHGCPYYELMSRRLKITERETLNHSLSLAKLVLRDADIESRFASPLVMDGKVAVMERQEIDVNYTDVPSLFEPGAIKNLVSDLSCNNGAPH